MAALGTPVKEGAPCPTEARYHLAVCSHGYRQCMAPGCHTKSWELPELSVHGSTMSFVSLSGVLGWACLP